MPFFTKTNLHDWNEFRPMVRWFSPIVLLKTVEKVLAATLFARYADRRLVHAALDSPIDKDKLIEDLCGGKDGLCKKTDGEPVWMDYVADLGDGFDSTYSIAYLIGSQEIEVDGFLLPRADCLIMGGDQVYPDASETDYQKRMQRPYRYAFPRNEAPGNCHPHVFMIPGNHDWYDGLTLFLAKFCNGRSDNYLGSWIASQRRSYFAVHLAHNWWIWGFDSQLGEDVDDPQDTYFTAVAERMNPGAKIILCGSVPTWLRASLAETNPEIERKQFYRGIDHIGQIARKHCSGAKIPLVLAGDLHHYTRYASVETGTNFITAGGGGAFLHPTHGVVSDQMKIRWARQDQLLNIGESRTSTGTVKAVYPPEKASRRMALGNILFWFDNWDFSLVLGVLYLCCALAMLSWRGYGEILPDLDFSGRIIHQLSILSPTPIFVVIAIMLTALIVRTADIRTRIKKLVTAGTHSMLHLGLILSGTALLTTAISYIWDENTVLGEIVYFLLLVSGMLLLGFVGGFVWGLYLTVVSYLWGDEANSAFSAMRLNSYKNFVRLKIEENKLTIFPIGVDKVPGREGWMMNPDLNNETPSQDTPAVIPVRPLGQHFIETPIEVDLAKISPLAKP